MKLSIYMLVLWPVPLQTHSNGVELNFISLFLFNLAWDHQERY